MTNKDLDKWIAEHIMGWHSTGPHWVDKNHTWKGYADEIMAGTHYDNEWNPTESISDAFQVVEKLIADGKVGYFEVCRYADVEGSVPAWVSFNGKARKGYDVEAEGETAPLAICLAAKAAVEARE